MVLIDWFIHLDATVQVALLGLTGGALAGIFGLIREFTNKDDQLEDYHKVVHIKLDDFDGYRIDKLTTSIDTLADTIDRYRSEQRR